MNRTEVNFLRLLVEISRQVSDSKRHWDTQMKLRAEPRPAVDFDTFRRIKPPRTDSRDASASLTFLRNRNCLPNDEQRRRLWELVWKRHELEMCLTQQIGLQQMIRKDWVRIQRSITRGLAAGSQIILEEFQSKAVSNFFPPFNGRCRSNKHSTVSRQGLVC